MHQPESILGNQLYKILLDFEIQTDHLIPAGRPNLELIWKKKRTCCLVDFAVPADHRAKIKENEMIDKYLDFVKGLKKVCHVRVTVIPIVVGALGTVPKEKEIRTIIYQKKNRNHSEDKIVEIGWNTEKCPGDLKSLVITKIPGKSHQLTLVWKTRSEL